MKYIIPSSLRHDEFIKLFYSNFYRLSQPVGAVIIKEIDAPGFTSVKKHSCLLVIDISLCGWCYAKMQDRFDFFPCKFLQLQSEIHDIPSEYTIQFSSAKKEDIHPVADKNLSDDGLFYSDSNSFSKSPITFVNEDPRSVANKKEQSKQAKKPAKMKCRKCCTTSTPEWRSGPNGKNSLCNACGLKWSKSQQKESINNNNNFDHGIKRTVHSFFPSTPKAEVSSSDDSLKSAAADNVEKKSKKSPSVELQAIDDKHNSSETPAPINKFSLEFILS